MKAYVEGVIKKSRMEDGKRIIEEVEFTGVGVGKRSVLKIIWKAIRSWLGVKDAEAASGEAGDSGRLVPAIPVRGEVQQAVGDSRVGGVAAAEPEAQVVDGVGPELQRVVSPKKDLQKSAARRRVMCSECGKRPAVWKMAVWRFSWKVPLCRVCARKWKRYRVEHHKKGAVA